MNLSKPWNSSANKTTGWNHRRKYPMMALWQYHLIGRVDDVLNFKVVDPRGHGDYDLALKTRVRWSKNMMEERQCPPQILLGSMHPLFWCVAAAWDLLGRIPWPPPERRLSLHRVQHRESNKEPQTNIKDSIRKSGLEEPRF
jgi:hypothetical protein